MAAVARACSFVSILCFAATANAQTPLTVAESSEYKATSKYADVQAFCEQLAKANAATVRFSDYGLSHEKRKLPLLIIADPPISTPQEASSSGKLLVFAQGNIHAGEVDGKEALLMLARELAQAKDREILKNVIFAVAPIVNPDGNERLADTNRPGQNGPAQVGTRANAQGRDLNRDFVKLDSPEVQALVAFYRKWNPAVVIDTHTTNGSRHRYTMTYDGPRHPAIAEKLTAYVRDILLPDVGKRLEKKTGFASYFYGNFNRDRTHWESYPALPRYGTQYVGLRGRIAILTESYSYASYKDRVIASREFVRGCLEFISQNKEAVRKVLDEASKPITNIALSHRQEARAKPVTILGYDLGPDGKTDLQKPKDLIVQQIDRAAATTTASMPFGYIIPPQYGKVVENLQRHGIEVLELREDIELPCEGCIVQSIAKAGQAYQGHNLVKVESTPPRASNPRIAAGSFFVRAAQPLGRLAAILLESGSEDGLAVWGFLDAGLKAETAFPILRVTKDVPLYTIAAKPLAEERTIGKRIQVEHYLGGMPAPDLDGTPLRGVRWLADGEHFIQSKRGRQWKVHAASGRVEPLPDTSKLAKSIADALKISTNRAEQIAAGRDRRMNAQLNGFLFQEAGQLHFASIDGTKVLRLTKGSGTAELATFSPDGQWVAFVRDRNLFAVDIATQTERKLTTDGGGKISNGKAVWVYFEEIFNRNEQAYWWSPDSKQIAFIRYDDTPVSPFTVVDFLPTLQKLEQTPYPKSGNPNPHARLGVVAAAGGPARIVEPPGYKPEDTLLLRAAWAPDSSELLFYLQDRAQTWLDIMSLKVAASSSSASVRKILRETTKAWVDDPGEPEFLKDGTFLLLSERDGWKHLYHYGRDGNLIRRVTEGPWEVRAVHRVDEKNGWVYFSGTAENPIARNVYRVPLRKSGPLEFITRGGDHRVSFSPTGSYFIDTVSSNQAPTTVSLKRLDGSLERRLDTNPVRALEEYQLAKVQLVKIPLPDGCVLEGSVMLPLDFDAAKKYPVWFSTYGGPHAPTVQDAWSSRILDHALASLGIIVFKCDPRSASGKGAISTWSAYKRLGIQELKDIEGALDWLAKTYPCVDTTKIGMNGASYGGFMTLFCMTHSKRFAAGISVAPVTDWSLYDSIYTERYMDTPKQNAKGYADTSVIRAARNLHGKLLLIHGLMDDNVHVQNSVKLIEEFQKYGVNFEMMFYPQARHGVGGPYQRHYQKLTLEFIRRTMGK